jgi:outer membrane protein assembly factor BamB
MMNAQHTTLLAILTLACGFAPIAHAADWLQFRGNDQRAVVADTNVPTEWNVGEKSDGSDSKNIAWKHKLPGRGVSSPIVVRGKVIATSASGALQERLHVHCFDAASGKLAWERQFWATGRTFCHPSSSVAACSPASDGQHIFAFFSSNDLICLDLEGNLKWYRGLTYDYPTAANDVGMSSSPLVIGQTVIVQVENKGESFAAGIDAYTGETKWKHARKADMCWTSPTVMTGSNGMSVVLLQSTDRLTAHDPATGKQLWTFDKSCSGIPSSVGQSDIAFIPSDGITAVKQPGGTASPEVLWSNNKLSPGTPSPIVVDDKILVINGAGALTAANTADGEVAWRARLKGSFWATPVVAGNHLYVVNRDGIGQVLKLGKEGEIVGENKFGEPVVATPAIADGALYVRGDQHLFKVAKP